MVTALGATEGLPVAGTKEALGMRQQNKNPAATPHKITAIINQRKLLMI